MRKVYVTSNNDVKVNVVRGVYNKLFGVCEVTGFKTKSGVPEQPTDDETERGAVNRFKDLMKQIEENEFEYPDDIVSIENGVRCIDKDHVEDFCVIYISNDQGILIQYSEGTLVPRRYYDKSEQTGFAKTMGSFIEFENNYENGCWHEHFGTGQTRSEIIESVLERML